MTGWRTWTYTTLDDAHSAAQVLEDFGLRPMVMGPIRVLIDGGEAEHWEVACAIGFTSAPTFAEPMDVDELDAGRSTIWDTRAEDRAARD